MTDGTEAAALSGAPAHPHALLVHGMGRTQLSMIPLAWALRRCGARPHLFGYVAAAEPVEHIVARLTLALEARHDTPYIAIGHSLGGLLLRAAIARLGPRFRRPGRLILLGTPNHSPRLARRFRDRPAYRVLAGEAGALLADIARMEALPPGEVPTTVVVGTGGRFGGFDGEANDGVVAASEARLDGAEIVELPVWHTFMMNAPAVRALCCRWAGAPDDLLYR